MTPHRLPHVPTSSLSQLSRLQALTQLRASALLSSLLTKIVRRAFLHLSESMPRTAPLGTRMVPVFSDVLLVIHDVSFSGTPRRVIDSSHVQGPYIPYVPMLFLQHVGVLCFPYCLYLTVCHCHNKNCLPKCLLWTARTCNQYTNVTGRSTVCCVFPGIHFPVQHMLGLQRPA